MEKEPIPQLRQTPQHPSYRATMLAALFATLIAACTEEEKEETPTQNISQTEEAPTSPKECPPGEIQVDFSFTPTEDSEYKKTFWHVIGYNEGDFGFGELFNHTEARTKTICVESTELLEVPKDCEAIQITVAFVSVQRGSGALHFTSKNDEEFYFIADPNEGAYPTRKYSTYNIQSEDDFDTASQFSATVKAGQSMTILHSIKCNIPPEE